MALAGLTLKRPDAWSTSGPHRYDRFVEKPSAPRGFASLVLGRIRVLLCRQCCSGWVPQAGLFT